MSMAQTEILSAERASYGGFVDAVGGLATIVLAIAGLAGVAPNTMLSIVTVIFGAALLIQGGALLSEYARVVFPAGTTAASIDQFGGGALSAIFLVGAAGMVLGVLALLGVYSVTLTAAAVIAFGAGMVMSSRSLLNLHMINSSSSEKSATHETRAGSEILAAEMASSSAGFQTIAGLAAIVLGILAIVGMRSDVLSLVALLALGATLVLTGSALSGVVLSFMRPVARS
jgi:hypothetical protein